MVYLKYDIHEIDKKSFMLFRLDYVFHKMYGNGDLTLVDDNTDYCELNFIYSQNYLN